MKNTPLRRHRPLLTAVLLVLLIALAAVPAGAYTTITPRLTIIEEYTDNVDRVATGERDDFITTVAPGILVELLKQDYRASLSYSPGFVFHQRDSRNDYVSHTADAMLSALLSQQTTLTFTDRFLRSNEPRTTYGDEAYGEWIDPTLRRGRETWYTNTANLALEHRFGQEDILGVGYRHRWLENDDPLLVDSQRHSPWVGLMKWFTPTFGLDTELAYDLGMFDAPYEDIDQYRGTIKAIHRLHRHFQWYLRYTHTEVDYDGSTPDYTVYDPGIGFSWAIAKDTTLDLDVGYFFQKRDVLDEESGLSFKGKLEKKYRKGSLQVTGESGYEEASYGAEALGLDMYYQAGARATYDLTSQLSLSADAAYRYNEYVNSSPRREDDVYNTAVGLNYKPTTWRWMTLSLTGRRYDVQSTDERNDLTENSVMLSISLTPVTPYRFD